MIIIIIVFLCRFFIVFLYYLKESVGRFNFFSVLIKLTILGK